jgi:hypothetical protein
MTDQRCFVRVLSIPLLVFASGTFQNYSAALANDLPENVSMPSRIVLDAHATTGATALAEVTATTGATGLSGEVEMRSVDDLSAGVNQCYALVENGSEPPQQDPSNQEQETKQGSQKPGENDPDKKRPEPSDVQGGRAEKQVDGTQENQDAPAENQPPGEQDDDLTNGRVGPAEKKKKWNPDHTVPTIIGAVAAVVFAVGGLLLMAKAK